MFAARAALVFVLAVHGGISPAWAGIPTFDFASMTNALKSIEQSKAQIDLLMNQYTTLQTQLATQADQLTNMRQNTAVPAGYIWDQASANITQLRDSIDTLSQYKNQVGSIDSYLSKFQDVAYYESSPCFKPPGCSDAQFAALGNDGARLSSETQKKSNDALFKGLDRQITALKNDADQLQRLQKGAQGATGQMQAIQFASQLASHQSNQLLQIRGLLIAQQNTIATRNQALADREAIEAASSAVVRRGAFAPSPARNW